MFLVVPVTVCDVRVEQLSVSIPAMLCRLTHEGDGGAVSHLLVAEVHSQAGLAREQGGFPDIEENRTFSVYYVFVK